MLDRLFDAVGAVAVTGEEAAAERAKLDEGEGEMASEDDDEFGPAPA